MARYLLPLVLAASLGAPALAAHQPGSDAAEARLRVCLQTGASMAEPIAGLSATVIRVRAYCGAQIRRVQSLRIAAATRGLSGDAAQRARTRAIRQLNAEIAHAVGNFSGQTN